MVVHILVVVMFFIIFLFLFLLFFFALFFLIRFAHEYCCPMNKREQHTPLSQNHSCMFFNVHDTTQTYGQLTC